MTHGTISRRIQMVEGWLGTPLFERHARGVVLTPAGQRFAAQTERALSLIAETAEQWRPRRGIPTVKVSVLPSFAKLWLLPRLVEVQGNPQDIRVELLFEHRLSDVAGGQADVALRYGQGHWPGLNAHELFGERLYPVASPRLAAALGDAPGPDAIAALPLLHDSDTSQWRAWLAANGLRYAPRAIDRRFEDYDLVLAAAEAGLGVALLRSPLADHWVKEGRLLPLSGSFIDNPLKHFVVLRDDETRGAVLRFSERLMACADHFRQSWPAHA